MRETQGPPKLAAGQATDSTTAAQLMSIPILLDTGGSVKPAIRS